jgi:hypothetical protein
MGDAIDSTENGFDKDSPTIALFWEMITDRFDDDTRCKFLAFVWARSRLPTRFVFWCLFIVALFFFFFFFGLEFIY